MQGPLTKTKNGLWWLACAAAAAVYLASAPRLWQCEGLDEIEYLGVGHSLARGFGYTLYGEPYSFYPPLYPLLLSAPLAQSPLPWALLYRLNGLMGLGGIALLGAWLRDRFGAAGRWAAWLGLVSYYAWSFSTRYLLSEPLALLLTAVALVACWSALAGGQRRGRWTLLAGVSALLCAMTRFGSVALVAACVMAGLVRWLGGRDRQGLYVLLICGVLGGGFLAAWELRGRAIAPDAVESYSRWVLKAVGLSGETSGMIASSPGEGVDASLSWPGRTGLLLFKTGQYLLSAVRAPSNLGPLAYLLSALVLAGLFVHLREHPWSPPGWYTLFSLLMISCTSWVSSYHRYLYLIGPLLYFFLGIGLLRARDMLAGRYGRRLAGLFAGVGVLGLIVSIRDPSSHGFQSPESAYLGSAFALLVLVYIGLTALWGRALVTGRTPSARAWVAWAVALVVLAAMQTSVLALARSRVTRANLPLRTRRLDGLVEAGAWLNRHAGADARCVNTLPRLLAFLADRRCMPPRYRADGQLDMEGVSYVVKSGELAIPAFRAGEESRLGHAADGLADEGVLAPVFASGRAAVYVVVANPPGAPRRE